MKLTGPTDDYLFFIALRYISPILIPGYIMYRSHGEMWLESLIIGIIIYKVGAFADPEKIAEKKARIAEFQAKEYLARQKTRLAEKDAPIEVASQIALMQAEAEIELWTARGNAEKVLEFTKKKFELEQELKARGRLQ